MKNKRVHIIIATTLFAVFLWVSVKLGDQYHAAITVPFSIDNIPSGTAPKSRMPRTVQLHFRGEGWRMTGLLLSGDLRCAIDLKAPDNQKNSITLNDVVEHLNVPVGVQAVDMDPDSIYMAFDSVAWKKVPVRLDYSALFKDHYGQVGPTVVTPESVRIEGARSVVESISSWPTIHQTLEDLKSPVRMSVPLAPSDIYQLSFSPTDVEMRIDVQWLAEKVFAGISVEILSVPPHREVILVPPKIEVVVRGGVNQLSTISLSDFRSSVDYGVLLSDTSGTIEPVVEGPAGVHVVSKRPDRLQYVIRKRL